MIRRKNERTCEEHVVFGGPGIAKNCKIIEKDVELNGKGRLFNHVYLNPGNAVGYHVHNGDGEIYYVLKGKGEYNDNGNISEIMAGDVTFCFPGEGHGLLNTGNETIELIALILYA